MNTLTLPTIPAHAVEARETFSFTVTPAVLMEAQRASPFRGPEACLRKLGHQWADAKREAFRAGVHPDLPDSWVRTEVTLYALDGLARDTQVEVALLVEPPEPLGVWEASPGSAPALTNLPVVSSETEFLGYCTVDGRPVYYPGP